MRPSDLFPDELEPIYVCPYCGNEAPGEWETWRCCGEVGHATLVDPVTGEELE